LEVSVRRVQQVLQSTPYLKYETFIRAPYMLQRQRSARLSVARDWIKNQPNWRRVVFTDEKNLN